MFIKDGNEVSPDAWIVYSPDGSKDPATMVQTQPKNATPEQLVLMGVTVVPDPAPVPVPPPPVETISNRQFYQQLAVLGVVTEHQALAAVTIGTLPGSIASFANAETDKFAAEMQLRGGTAFNRHDPLFMALGQVLGFTPKQLDDFWIAAAQL
jgi:hypothetical protein